MLKYYDIIEKLSDRDKIRILSDVNNLSTVLHGDLSLPQIRIGAVEDYCGSDYPSPVALTNSWNPALVERCAEVLVSRAVSDGNNLIKIPAAKPKINPYRSALSEDICLAAAMSSRYLASAEKVGVAAAIKGFGLREDEAEWLDKSPDQRFLKEYFVKPYSLATTAGECAAVLTEPDLDRENYGEVNSELKKTVSDDGVCSGAVGICDKVSADKTVTYLEHGGLFFNGSSHALESALTRYKQLKNAIEHGTATTEELEEALESGKAIAPEMIDESVDRLLEFAFAVNEKKGAPLEAENEDPAFDATLESIVLLKNRNKILPLEKSAKVAIIGDIAMKRDENGKRLSDLCAEGLAAKGCVLSGRARGYDLERDRSEELIDRAVAVAEMADVVLLFLGFGEKREKRIHRARKLTIPANQQELLCRLSEYKEKIIAILPPEHTPDVSLPDNCEAIMLAPLETKYSAEALVGVLMGEHSPSGKLASTVYSDTTHRYVKRKTEVERDKMKTGIFIGYRYYDTAGEDVGFPFGHGLSYSRFTYSNLFVGKDTVIFRLKNCGKMAAAETVQLYVGCRGKGFVRPMKELCAFEKVFLKAGESRVIELPLQLPTAYDVESDSFVEEKGKYEIFIGSSVSDIRLSCEIRAGEQLMKRCSEKRTAYVHTESNIITDNFKLEAKADIMRKSVFNFIAGALSLIMALALKMYCVFAGVNSVFFELFAVLLAILGIVFFIVEAARRGRIRSDEKKKLEKIHAQEFKEAEQVDVYSASKMFVREFDINEEVTSNEIPDDIDRLDNEQLSHIDKDQSFASAAADFAVFARERGYKFAPDAVNRIFASIAASRIVVVAGMSNSEFNTFMLLLSNYFHTSAYVDVVDDSYVNGDSLLYKLDEYGNRVKTHANLAIEAARNTTYSAHFIGLSEVKASSIPAYFSLYMKYVKNPTGCKYIVTMNERYAETSYYTPHNLWFVMNLAAGESAEMLPDFIAEIATVNTLKLEECEASEDHTHVREFSYYQIEYLVEKAVSRFSVDEDFWKKVDRLEEYVNGRTEYHIGNKTWLGLEKYAYTYMACGGEKAVAVDSAVAAAVLPSVLIALKDQKSDEERSIIETLELIFGEENVYACKELVRYCESAEAIIKADEDEKAREEEARLIAEAEAIAAQIELLEGISDAAELDIDAEPETVSELDIEAEPEAEQESETEVKSETEVESESELEAEAEAEADV